MSSRRSRTTSASCSWDTLVQAQLRRCWPGRPASRVPPRDAHYPLARVSRIDIDPGETDAGAFYFFLNSVVIPRPIAWVSSRSASGVDNLAPHSFFTVSSVDPPIVQFTSVGRKDSLENVEHTREFVVCLTPAALLEQVNATATNFPPEISEFDAVGLEREPSV